MLAVKGVSPSRWKGKARVKRKLKSLGGHKPGSRKFILMEGDKHQAWIDAMKVSGSRLQESNERKNPAVRDKDTDSRRPSSRWRFARAGRPWSGAMASAKSRREWRRESSWCLQFSGAAFRSWWKSVAIRSWVRERRSAGAASTWIQRCARMAKNNRWSKLRRSSALGDDKATTTRLTESMRTKIPRRSNVSLSVHHSNMLKCFRNRPQQQHLKLDKLLLHKYMYFCL